jgi:uncharacterized membrane protein YfcA
MALLGWLPPEVLPATAAVLLAVRFVASMRTAALGLGGGTLMLAVVASVLPPHLVIAVHGFGQIGSKAGRAAILYRHLDAGLIGRFALGSVVGVAARAMVVVRLPVDMLRLVLALFILWSCFGRGPRPHAANPHIFLPLGAVTSFLTIFIGASGAFVAASSIPIGSAGTAWSQPMPPA